MNEQTIVSESASTTVRHELPQPLLWLLILKEILLLPGTLIHEISHYLAALLLDLDIYDWSFVDHRSHLTSGYFEVEMPRSYIQTVLFNLAPLIGNSLFAGIIFAGVVQSGDSTTSFVVLYIGVAIAARAIPSASDFQNIESWRDSEEERAKGMLSVLVYGLRRISASQLFGLDVAAGIGFYILIAESL